MENIYICSPMLSKDEKMNRIFAESAAKMVKERGDNPIICWDVYDNMEVKDKLNYEEYVFKPMKKCTSVWLTNHDPNDVICSIVLSGKDRL